jgi:nucleotide-binding universal stress UspA family protein
MFRRILVAVGDDEQSAVTLSFVTALARQHDAHVHVLHVNELVVGGRGVPLRTDDEATAIVVDAMHHLGDEGIVADGSVWRAHYGKVAQRIASMAEECAADVIVLGSTRRRRWGRLMSMQIRERTTRLTTLPVVVAPAPLELGAPASASTEAVPARATDRDDSLLA